jgi:hypothetical protein
MSFIKFGTDPMYRGVGADVTYFNAPQGTYVPGTTSYVPGSDPNAQPQPGIVAPGSVPGGYAYPPPPSYPAPPPPSGGPTTLYAPTERPEYFDGFWRTVLALVDQKNFDPRYVAANLNAMASAITTNRTMSRQLIPYAGMKRQPVVYY